MNFNRSMQYFNKIMNDDMYAKGTNYSRFHNLNLHCFFIVYAMIHNHVLFFKILFTEMLFPDQTRFRIYTLTIEKGS